jgi:hypothetical protein
MYCFGDHAQSGSVEAKFPIGYRGMALFCETTKLEAKRLSYRSQSNKTKRPEENCVGHLSLIPPYKFLFPTVLGDSALHEQQYFYRQQYSNCVRFEVFTSMTMKKIVWFETTFRRNVGSNQSHTVLYPRRRYSSQYSNCSHSNGRLKIKKASESPPPPTKS